MLTRKKMKISTNQIKTQTLKKEKDNRKKRDSFLTFSKIIPVYACLLNFSSGVEDSYCCFGAVHLLQVP